MTASEFKGGRENSMLNYLQGIGEHSKQKIKEMAADAKENYSRKNNVNRAYWLGRLRGLGDVQKLARREMANEN